MSWMKHQMYFGQVKVSRCVVKLFLVLFFFQIPNKQFETLKKNINGPKNVVLKYETRELEQNIEKRRHAIVVQAYKTYNWRKKGVDLNSSLLPMHERKQKHLVDLQQPFFQVPVSSFDLAHGQ